MKNIIILIGGGSASGKTLLAHEIINNLRMSVTYVPMDMYCKPHPWMSLEERAALNYDHPDAYDHKLLYEHLLKLKKDQNIEMPIYDFKTHDVLNETKIIKPSRIIIVDGILTLHYEELKNLADFKIYMDAKEETRLERRIKRDVLERGRTEESVRKQFALTVKPMHDLYIEPCKNHADFIFSNEGNTGLDKKTLERLFLKLKILL